MSPLRDGGMTVDGPGRLPPGHPPGHPPARGRTRAHAPALPRGSSPAAGYAGPVTTEDPTAPQPSTPKDAPARTEAPAGAGQAFGDSAPTEPVDVPTRTLVLVGTAIWAVGLVVTLVVPSLHSGDRSWWPWACVTGIALGGFALWYTRGGTGTSADV